MAAAVSGCSTNTFERESSAAFTSNDGFSVVAPMSTMSPASTRGRKASCCALLKRWISSTKTIVRAPAAAAARLRRRHDLLDLLDAGEHGAERARSAPAVISAMMRASVVLPVPGGPHRMIDCSRSRSIASRSGRPGARISSWPTTSSSVRGRMRSASGVPGAPPAPSGRRRIAASSNSDPLMRAAAARRRRAAPPATATFSDSTGACHRNRDARVACWR